MSASSDNSRPSDRRRYWRFLGEPIDVLVHGSGKTVSGNLVNESIGGIAFVTQDDASFVVGQSVETKLRDTTVEAYVRSVRRQLGGRIRIGLSWDREGCRDAAATANYLNHEDMMLLCRVVSNTGEGVQTVQLWDGAEFPVFIDDIFKRTYDERRDELNRSPNTLATLVQLYGLETGSDPNEMVSEILDFEFSEALTATEL